MEYIRIKYSNEKVSKNFSLAEYYASANPSHEFDIPKTLIDAAQILRDWYQGPLRLTSSYRPHDSFGYHRLGKAIDLVAADGGDVISPYNHEVDEYIKGNGSDLIDKLRKAGITGLGKEDVCIHIDVRPEASCNRSDKHGKYLAFRFKCHYENGMMVIDENYAL
jgi:hypothetical protein